MQVATHKTLGTSDVLAKRYSKQVLVYLESEFDVVIYRDKWFFEFLDKIQFRQASEGAASHLGCTAVIESVTIDRSSGVEAFGIVDRDALMGADLWPLVWEADDARYKDADPFGKFVVPTLRWELENYLVEPLALEEFLVNHENGRPARVEEEIWADLWRHCDALVPLAACNAACHRARSAKVGDGASNGRTREQTQQFLVAGPVSALPETSRDEYQNFLQQSDAFGSGETMRDRTRGLLRRVEGKALISRIRYSHRISDHPELHIADAIRRLSIVPAELSSLIRKFATGLAI